MRLKKIALACAMAFTLALPFSGFTANGPVSVVEAASSASVCEKATTTVTPTVNSYAIVTFKVTKSSKVNMAKDLNTILGIAIADGAGRTISIDGVNKKLVNKGGTIYIDNKKLVDYVKSISTTTTTVKWKVNTKTIQYVSAFAKLSAIYAYAITIDGVEFRRFTSNTVNVAGKTYNYSIVNGSFVFEGNLKTVLKSLKCATVKVDDKHELTKVATVAATPTKLGHKAYYKCKDCGKLFRSTSCDKVYTLAELKTSTFKSNSGVLKSTEGTKADGQWYKVKNGVADTSFTGFANNSSGWWYIQKGKVNFNKKGLVKGTVNGESGYWYVADGKVQFIDTVEKNENGWWAVQNGKVNFNFTGFAKNTNGWWYCENGQVNLNKKDIIKGTVNGESGWWFVSGGQVQFINSVEKNDNGWWAIENGKVNFNFTGIAKNSNGSWYCKGGQVQFDYSGKVVYNGKTYTIKNGKVQ